MDTTAASRTDRTMNPLQNIARVALRAADTDRMTDFYTQVLGFVPGEASSTGIPLHATPAADPLLVIEKLPHPGHSKPSSTGLFHVAFLLPSQEDLSRMLRHLAEIDWPLEGAADHLVSEALYLSDPEGNGIELYVDRPRTTWSFQGSEIRMATLPLDLPALLDKSTSGIQEWTGAPPSSTVGHIHLRVSSLRKAERFYHEILGFDVTTRSYPGALFVAANGYHHHVGLNTWTSLNGSAASADAPGLSSFTIRVGGNSPLDTIRTRLDRGSIPWTMSDNGQLCTQDLDGLRVEFETLSNHQREHSPTNNQLQRSIS
jgi:catechol 2,3-dioxygenase